MFLCWLMKNNNNLLWDKCCSVWYEAIRLKRSVKWLNHQPNRVERIYRHINNFCSKSFSKLKIVKSNNKKVMYVTHLGEGGTVGQHSLFCVNIFKTLKIKSIILFVNIYSKTQAREISNCTFRLSFVFKCKLLLL